jgi:hypothetical protein
MTKMLMIKSNRQLRKRRKELRLLKENNKQKKKNKNLQILTQKLSKSANYKRELPKLWNKLIIK